MPHRRAPFFVIYAAGCVSLLSASAAIDGSQGVLLLIRIKVGVWYSAMMAE